MHVLCGMTSFFGPTHLPTPCSYTIGDPPLLLVHSFCVLTFLLLCRAIHSTTYWYGFLLRPHALGPAQRHQEQSTQGHQRGTRVTQATLLARVFAPPTQPTSHDLHRHHHHQSHRPLSSQPHHSMKTPIMPHLKHATTRTHSRASRMRSF
jgi:hypothetical protein